MMQNEQPELIQADKSHLDEMMEIEKASFHTPWSRMFFLNILEGANTYCSAYQERGRILGYSLLVTAGDEGEIYNIAVAPECRGRGVGTRILNSSIACGRKLGLCKLYLEVRVGNANAISMYKGAGFTGQAVRRWYYTCPIEDALIMTYDYGQLL